MSRLYTWARIGGHRYLYVDRYLSLSFAVMKKKCKVRSCGGLRGGVVVRIGGVVVRKGGVVVRIGGVEVRKGGVVFLWSMSLPLDRPSRGFESWPGRASPQCGLRGGRSHCNTLQIT